MNQGTIVVFNLDETIQQLFNVYGEIKDIRSTPNKKHHRFIEFYDTRAAENALKGMNGTQLNGKKLKIEFSRPGGKESSFITEDLIENFNPQETHPVLFETAIICATVGIMCPAMSFIAAFLYYNYQAGFNMWTLLAEWLKLMCYNFPFAFFTQLFFIQPCVRTVFKQIFAKDIKARKEQSFTV